MVWGAVDAVPTLGWIGGALLVSLLVGLAWWRKPGPASTVLGLSLALGFTPVAEAQIVSVPNALTNGSVADANVINENFEELEIGVNAALTSSSVLIPNIFTNGTTADAEEMNENFAELEMGVNAALTNRATDCVGSGGIWDTGTSTCTPGYDCFTGGFCSQAAIDFPPSEYGYTNVYEGDTQNSGAPLLAGCNTEAGADAWITGQGIRGSDGMCGIVGLMAVCQHH